MLDFSQAMYRRLVCSLKNTGRRFVRFRDLDRVGPEDSVVLLRHDVDRLPGRSLQMARIEWELGICSTYFFRTKPWSFSEKIIERILVMGHEVGYHYESLSDARGDYARAWELFIDGIETFRPLTDIKTIAMHGRPLSPWDNRMLWQHYDYRDAGVDREAYLDIDGARFMYITDTGRRWDGEGNMRDHLQGTPRNIQIRTTEDLIGFVGAYAGDLVVSSHPERWTAGPVGWTQAWATDVTVQVIKRLVQHTRSVMRTVRS